MTNRVTTLEQAAANVTITVGIKDIGCRVSCVGLAGVENVLIQHVMNGTPESSGKSLIATDPGMGIFAAGVYKLTKSTTASPSAICIDGLPANAIDVE